MSEKIEAKIFIAKTYYERFMNWSETEKDAYLSGFGDAWAEVQWLFLARRAPTPDEMNAHLRERYLKAKRFCKMPETELKAFCAGMEQALKLIEKLATEETVLHTQSSGEGSQESV